jgi:NAD(P)-dependent dehydrogenase (short-subunit alcohol dehydrogenase family)
MRYLFEDQVAIVTGAGGGIGRYHALDLASRGCKVVVNDLGGALDGSGGDSDMANAVVEEITAAGGEAIANVSSVADAAGAQGMVTDAMNAWGRVDILINNAGILRENLWGDVQMGDFRLVLDVHLLGAAFVTQAVWPIMKARNYGRIVLTSSPSGLYGYPSHACYAAAKMAQVGLMNALKIEGADHNIHTNVISPVAATRMTEGQVPQEVLDALAPELVTPAVTYLCTTVAPNGVILQAQGGKFSVASVVENKGVIIGADATVEDIAENYERIVDLTGAKPRNML